MVAMDEIDGFAKVIDFGEHFFKVVFKEGEVAKAENVVWFFFVYFLFDFFVCGNASV